jgi:hypothetical protein
MSAVVRLERQGEVGVILADRRIAQRASDVDVIWVHGLKSSARVAT